MAALSSEVALEVSRRLLNELLPWSFADGALVLMLAPSIDEEDALENPNAVSIDPDGNLIVELVLVERDADSGVILDANEQPVALIPNVAEHAEARARSYLRGLELALERSVRTLPPEPRLPAHFVFADVLADSALKTTEDFARALAAPERLGSMK
jgi:hypothetical protein